MSPSAIFGTQLVLAYVPWFLLFGAFVWPRLKSMDHVQAQRIIASLHSFRFFGLVFILPGVVGPDLPAKFAISAAYGDLNLAAAYWIPILYVPVLMITHTCWHFTCWCDNC